jgi:protochlorophyllide reductase
MGVIGPSSRCSLCFRCSQSPTSLVGTNYLGHFYLNHLLLPKIETSSGKIVVTASGVHDPESPGGAQGETATLGNLEGFERDGKNFEMVNGEPYNGDKAYKDSKVRGLLVESGYY